MLNIIKSKLYGIAKKAWDDACKNPLGISRMDILILMQKFFRITPYNGGVKETECSEASLLLLKGYNNTIADNDRQQIYAEKDTVVDNINIHKTELLFVYQSFVYRIVLTKEQQIDNDSIILILSDPEYLTKDMVFANMPVVDKVVKPEDNAYLYDGNELLSELEKRIKNV